MGIDEYPQILRRVGEALSMCEDGFTGFSASELSNGTRANGNMRKWLKERLTQIGIQKNDKIVCIPEPALERDGLVLKCVLFDVRRKLQIPFVESWPLLWKKIETEPKGVFNALLREAMLQDDDSLLLDGEQMPPAVYSAESVHGCEVGQDTIAIDDGVTAKVTAMSPDLHIDAEQSGEVRPFPPGKTLYVTGPREIRLCVHDLVAGIFTCEFFKNQ